MMELNISKEDLDNYVKEETKKQEVHRKKRLNFIKHQQKGCMQAVFDYIRSVDGGIDSDDFLYSDKLASTVSREHFHYLFDNLLDYSRHINLPSDGDDDCFEEEIYTFTYQDTPITLRLLSGQGVCEQLFISSTAPHLEHGFSFHEMHDSILRLLTNETEQTPDMKRLNQKDAFLNLLKRVKAIKNEFETLTQPLSNGELDTSNKVKDLSDKTQSRFLDLERSLETLTNEDNWN